MTKSTKPLILHAFANSPNPLKISIALELLSLPYEINVWQFGDDPKSGVKGEAFATLSENGRVPVLEDPNTGVTAWESGAIMNYLRRKYDAEGTILGLTGKGSGEGGQVTDQDLVDFEKWEYLLLTTLAPFSGQVVWFKHYAPNEEARKRYEQQVLRIYPILENQLVKSDGKSIIPGGLTAVDMHWHAWCRHPEYMGIPNEGYPCMRKWVASIDEMPEAKAAYKKLYEASLNQATARMNVEGKVTMRDPALAAMVEQGKNL